MTEDREPGKEYILSLSYGKDSLACLAAIEQLGWPLDRIVHEEVWATDTIPADLPPMVEFKAKADEIILRRWGIKVEHVCAMRGGEKMTYEGLFYRRVGDKAYNLRKEKKKAISKYRQYNDERLIYGFPIVNGPWCNSELKMAAIRRVGGRNRVAYLGIAADETERIQRHTKPDNALPLVAIGWDEAYCRKWCEDNDLLSPIYTTAARGGCWFCHNQGVGQLRLLRKQYPEYWGLMLKWDNDSPVTFKADGHTLHDYEVRFAAEDAGLIDPEERFRWDMIGRQIVRPRVEIPGQITIEDLLGGG